MKGCDNMNIEKKELVKQIITMLRKYDKEFVINLLETLIREVQQ